MKKLIIIVVALALAGGAAYWVWTRIASAAAPVAPQATGKAEKGSIRQSVACNGKVASYLDVDIKCKASGEIIKLPFDISDEVKEGDLLMQLDPIYMERDVRRAEVAVNMSQARLKIAEQNLDVATRTLKTDTEKAQVTLTSCKAKAQDALSKAERLKELYDKKLAAQEEYETAQTAAVQAASDRDAAQVKLEELKTQELSLEQLRQQVTQAKEQVESDKISLDVAQQALKDTKVFAPKSEDGHAPRWIVSARNVQIGVIVSSGISNIGGGTTIMTLSDMYKTYVLATVDESDIGKVKLGQSAITTVDAYPGKKFRGKVVRIATKGVNISNVVTFEVKIEILPGRANGWNDEGGDAPERGPRGGAGGGPGVAMASFDGPPRGGEASGPATRRRPSDGGASSRPAAGEADDKDLLKPEMTTNTEIIAAQRKDVLTVPAECVIRKAGKNYCTLAATNEDREVQTGISDGTRTEIVSGLSEGDTLVLYKGQDSKWKADRPFNPGRVMRGR
ncbi:MAG: efflux RND transporter periplasmic adaptor subunit [Phycisphaerae bacterium]